MTKKKEKKLELTEENYFSPEAQMQYWGHTQFLDFQKCEARGLALTKGEYEQELSDALLSGQYVDAHFTGNLNSFKSHHPEMYKRDGSLKAVFVGAERAIARAERDEMFMKYISGVPQKIFTGKIFGYDWKIKVDAFHEGKAIVDLKCMKDFNPMYVDGMGRVSFVEAWGYDYQAAIYQKVVENVTGERLPFIIAGVTKQDPADIGLFKVPQHMIDSCLSVIENQIDRFAAIKAGDVEPKRCEKCDYCRETKVVSCVEEIEEEGEHQNEE